MAYQSGGTAHMPRIHQFHSAYGYGHHHHQPQTAQYVWPPPYYNSPSYQAPSKPQPTARPHTHGSTQNPTPPIQPDPLPPHSNPTQLTQTQTLAFRGPKPTPPLRLAKTDVLDPISNTPIFAISKEPVHLPSFLSSKPLLTLTSCATNARLGTIRFHSLTTSDIEITTRSQQQTVLSSSGLLHTRWTFQPTSSHSSQAWVWQRDKKSKKRAVILTDARKRGKVLARIDDRDVLSFEQVGLSDETVEEIVLTAVALGEYVRRKSRTGEVVDLAGAIADAAGASASDGGSGSHHGGGGCDGGGGGGDGGGGGGSC